MAHPQPSFDVAQRRHKRPTVREAFIAASKSAPTTSAEALSPAIPSAQQAAEALSVSLRSLDLSTLLQSTVEQQQPSSEQRAKQSVAEAGVSPELLAQGVIRRDAKHPDVPLQIGNGSVNRAQLRQRFLDLHFGTSNLAPFIFVYEVFDTDHDKQLATTTAVDTMCIAQMATSFQDSRLMRTAGVMYSRVAQMITRKLKRLADVTGPGSLDDIFGGIHALITCGFFSGLNIKAFDRECHVQGLEKITRSISNDRMSGSMREAFKHKWGRQAFWLAIKERKDLSKVESRVEFAERWRITDSESLSRLASQVPGLLERSDASFFERPSDSRVRRNAVLSFLTELETTVAGLKRWQLQWESTIPSPYQLKSIRSFEGFRGISSPHSEVFKTAYSFSNPPSERDFRVLQICLLSLDLTIIQLHQGFGRLLIDREVQIHLKRAEFGAELAVEALCMMVPWTARPETMAFAGVYTMPLLERAIPYFQASGKERELEWCHTVSKSLGDTHGVDFFVGQG